jgi:hypothetical protein
MKLHACARGLLAGAISVAALVGTTGVAQADDPLPPPGLPGIDRILLQTPVFNNPANEGGPGSNWGGVGMYCQNLFVRCSQESVTH